MEKIKNFLHALELDTYDEKTVVQTLDCFDELNVPFLSEDKVLVATTFYQLLRYCNNLYNEKITYEIQDRLLTVFENIRRIGVDATDEEKKNSSMITLWFLNELESRKGQGLIQDIDDDVLEGNISKLLEGLGDIQFIFQIKKDDKIVFPINKIIAKVVKKPEFINSEVPLSSYHIKVLQLAVKLFKDDPNDKQIINDLRKNCNLRFLNYLENSCEIIDTKDLLNNQKNGVMIFFDSSMSKVLIRHEREEYFLEKPVWWSHDVKVDSERDYQGKTIGYFIEYNLDLGDELVSFTDMLIEIEDRQEFLKLMYDKQAKNIFLEKSIIKKQDGSYMPLNPFCFKDDKIVKGKIGKKEGKSFAKDQVKGILNEYRNCSIKTSSTYVMNRVSLGLSIDLLEKSKSDFDCLQIDNYTDDDLYQNQMLKYWVLGSSNQMESLYYVLKKWCKELEYVKRNEIIKKYLATAQDFYPLSCNTKWIYDMLSCMPDECWYIFSGYSRKKNGEMNLVVELNQNSMGEKYMSNTNNSKTSIIIPASDLEDNDNFFDYDLENVDYCVLYNKTGQKVKLLNQDILNFLNELEEIQKENVITYNVIKSISKVDYNCVSEGIKLYKKAYGDVAKNNFEKNDFDTQVYYRLLHNMVWSKIEESKVRDYFKIFAHHELLSFENIKDDEYFKRCDDNYLYVPKDGRVNDAVLLSIYENYLKPYDRREINDLFNENIRLEDDGYYRKNRIEKIIFLCDNFEKGSATKRMLCAYLDIKTDDFDESSIEKIRVGTQKYYLSDKTEVRLKKLIELNNCEVEVHGYYGTKEGCAEIDGFLDKNGIKYCKTSFQNEIEKHSKQIETQVQNIWGYKPPNCFTVIREFNMTKRSVFHWEMVGDLSKAICLFVKKREFDIR